MIFVHAGMWSFIFRDVLVRLRREFRVLALDFPGYGLAPEPAAELGLSAMSDTLEQFVERLGLASVTLVLHDLGGPVGLGWAALHPDRVAGLVLANTFAWTPDRAALRAMLRLMSSAPMVALGTATNLIPRLSASKFGVGRHLDAESRRALLGPFRDRSRRRRFHRLMRSALQSPRLFETIEDASAGRLRTLPVLTIFGERNDPFGFQDRHAATFPNHVGLVVKGGYHFPMADDPDLFARSVRTWWKERVAGPAPDPSTRPPTSA